ANAHLDPRRGLALRRVGAAEDEHVGAGLAEHEIGIRTEAGPAGDTVIPRRHRDRWLRLVQLGPSVGPYPERAFDHHDPQLAPADITREPALDGIRCPVQELPH